MRPFAERPGSGRPACSCPAVRRVAVIGCGGAGKSTLARRLGRRTGLPVVHLDGHYWRPGWRPTDPETWRGLHEGLIAGERWIIDGNYGGTMEIRLAAADTIIFLDLPGYLCVWRAVKRYLQHLGRPRIDRAAGCSEKIDWPFLWYIWRYPATSRVRVLARLEQYAAGRQIVILRRQSEVRRFLDGLRPAQAA